jgi:uncharacterized protein
MSIVEIAALSLAGVAAGVVNAVAGGGTLITFPVLLFAGTPPVVANATSTLALVIGTSGGVYGFRRQIAAVIPWLRLFVPVSLLGGLLGGMVLTHTSERIFASLVPFLLLFATVLFLAQGVFRRYAGLNDSHRAGNAPHYKGAAVAVAFQFLVAVYGGYFGAGIGILMLASLGWIGLTDIHEMNGLKTVLGSLINMVAAFYFVLNGLIDWPRAGIVTVGAVAGYYIGAHCSQLLPQKRVRQIITAIGFIISAVLFYRQFFGGSSGPI